MNYYKYIKNTFTNTFTSYFKTIPDKSPNDLILDFFVFILLVIQIILTISIVIYYVNHYSFNKELTNVYLLKKNMDIINFFFLFFTGILMVYLFNTIFTKKIVEIYGMKKWVLYSTGVILIVYLLTRAHEYF
jgi:magnesium-transporting ATPase (P-type)